MVAKDFQDFSLKVANCFWEEKHENFRKVWEVTSLYAYDIYKKYLKTFKGAFWWKVMPKNTTFQAFLVTFSVSGIALLSQVIKATCLGFW